MTSYDEMWQEWKQLWERMLALEKKLEERIELCDAWYICKRIVYETIIIFPSLLFLGIVGQSEVEEYDFNGKKVANFV